MNGTEEVLAAAGVRSPSILQTLLCHIVGIISEYDDRHDTQISSIRTGRWADVWGGGGGRGRGDMKQVQVAAGVGVPSKLETLLCQIVRVIQDCDVAIMS